MATGLLAGVANVDLFDGDNKLIVSTKTLIDSGLNMGITGEEARGGQGNILLGKYFHDSSFGLTLTDQIWNMEYLALNCGGYITASSDVMTNEQVVTTEANKITVTQTPQDFTSTSGCIGWYKLATQSDNSYVKVTFDKDTKTANVTNLPANSKVCVKYVITSSSARKFVINADYIPAVCHAVMTIGLYKAGTTTETLTTSSKIGNIIVDIPNFQLEGGQDLSLSSSSIASIALNGNALATFTGDAGCSDHGYYSTITEDIFNQSEWDSVTTIVVANGDIELATNETHTINVYKMYNNGTQPSIVDNSKLTFTVKSGTSATVSTAGVVTAGSTTGITVIEIVATQKNTLSTTCTVTVE